MGTTIGNRERALATAVVALVVSACVFVGFGVAPGRAEVSDPLGLPARLVGRLTASADAFDRNSAVLVDQTTSLRERTAGLDAMAKGLAQLEDLTGRMATAAGSLDTRTAGVSRAAATLPAGVDRIAGQARQGSSGVGTLQSGLGTLDQALARLVAVLRSMTSSVGALGPKAHALASALDAIRTDTAALGTLQALLRGAGS